MLVVSLCDYWQKRETRRQKRSDHDFAKFRFIRIGDVPGSICFIGVFIFWFSFRGKSWSFAICSRKFGTKFQKIFERTQLFETRITRMVTYLVTLDSIGLGQFVRFVSGADGIGDTEGKAATGSGERGGRQASFKFVSRLPMSEGFRAFGVFRGQDYPQPILDAFKH